MLDFFMNVFLFNSLQEVIFICFFVGRASNKLPSMSDKSNNASQRSGEVY